MHKKTIKISLILTVLLLSTFFSIAVITFVQAKKKTYTSGPVYIDETVPGMTWMDWSAQPWLKGSGTEEDPYMIKNVVIDAGGYFFCMLIMNSDAYFKVMDCTFSNTGPYGSPDGRHAALILVSAQNGVLFKNEIFDCGSPESGTGSGIALIASFNNKIQKNLCHDNGGPGIYLQYSSNNIIRQNLCERNQWGIMVSEGSNNNEITKNECYENLAYGIHLWGDSNGNTVSKNLCSNNGGSGIILEGCYSNMIVDNDCSGNSAPNIYLRYSNDNLLTENLCTGSSWGIVIRWSHNNDVVNNECVENGEGIVLQEDSADNRIVNNICVNNLENGIILIFSANYNVIDHNDFSGNGLSGISVQYSEGNSITGNTCDDNGEQGIYIKDYSHYNTITDNNCSRNLDSGIVIQESNGTIVMDNFCSENIWTGIALVSGAENNIIYKNELVYNWGGVYFSYVSNNDVFRNDIRYNTHGIFMHRECYDNMIYQNNIIDNDMQVFDLSQGLNNWYNIYILEGNYWSDYTGTDSDGDGIGDTPWPEEGYDAYPFMDENGWEITTPLEDELLNVWFYPDFNRLGGYRTVHNNKTTYLMVGMGHAFSERVQDIYGPPYTCRLWFYGTEVYFQGMFSFFMEESPYGEPMWYHLFYLIIPPYTLLEAGLPPGWNEFQWELSFYSGGEQQFVSFTSYFYLI
ncbi:MAG: nitrous oxide reductase family maturation protein NosD [Promethearchaeota archaeon]